MSIIDHHIETYQFYRPRTLALLEKIEQQPDPLEVLGWRPGTGRAHLAWQLMHIGITEEIFATERLAPEKERHWEDLWPRFRGGSTPDDDIPAPGTIRTVLDGSRAHLLETLRGIGEDRLEEVPAALKERNLTIRQVLSIISWHEAHHQGQGHLTLNLHLAAKSMGR